MLYFHTKGCCIWFCSHPVGNPEIYRLYFQLIHIQDDPALSTAEIDLFLASGIGQLEKENKVDLGITFVIFSLKRSTAIAIGQFISEVVQNEDQLSTYHK